MDHQARGLVEDEHRRVLVQDVERDVLGHRVGLYFQDDGEGDGLAATDRIAPAHEAAVEQQSRPT